MQRHVPLGKYLTALGHMLLLLSKTCIQHITWQQVGTLLPWRNRNLAVSQWQTHKLPGTFCIQKAATINTAHTHTLKWRRVHTLPTRSTCIAITHMEKAYKCTHFPSSKAHSNNAHWQQIKFFLWAIFNATGRKEQSSVQSITQGSGGGVRVVPCSLLEMGC